MTFKEEWDKYGPKDHKSPVQEMHKELRGQSNESLLKAIICGALGAGLIGKAIYELWHNAYFLGCVETSENIYTIIEDPNPPFERKE